MSESKTPRTDEAQFGTGQVSVDLARQLETELHEAKRSLAEMMHYALADGIPIEYCRIDFKNAIAQARKILSTG